MKSNWKNYLIFSEKELKAVVVIGAFVIASIAMAVLFPAKKKIIHLFYFDPNSLDSLAAMQLGFMPKHYTTLVNYRNKGGRFYQAKDIFRWYGVKASLLKQVYPYVRIRKGIGKPNYIVAKKTLMDINKVGAGDLERLGFISHSLAIRIIKYRTFLGGFSSLGQLQKVYGMKESSFRQLLPYLSLEKGIKVKMHWATMNYKQIEGLHVFEPKEIWQLLRDRKQEGKAKDWADLIVQFDLSREQAGVLKAKTDIR